MFVCVCRSVSERSIAAAVRGGSDSFEALQLDLGVSLQCGQCEGCVRGLLAATLAEAPGAHAATPRAIDCVGCVPAPLPSCALGSCGPSGCAGCACGCARPSGELARAA
jgi:bacterioferritin-associated ferredoxin